MSNIPVLHADVKELTFTSNIEQFEIDSELWLTGIPSLNYNSTDADFVLADDNIKALVDFEDRIKTAQNEVMKECGDLYDFIERTSAVKAKYAAKRIPMKKDFKDKKDEIKAFVVQVSVDRAKEHVEKLSETLEYDFDWPVFVCAPKNKRKIDKYTEACQEALDAYMVVCDQFALNMTLRSKAFVRAATGHEYLFPDDAKIIQGMESSLIANVVRGRISEAKQAQEAAALAAAAEVTAVAVAVVPDVVFETVESVDFETGEVVEESVVVDTVTLPRAELIEVLEGVIMTMLDNGLDQTSSYVRATSMMEKCK